MFALVSRIYTMPQGTQGGAHLLTTVAGVPSVQFAVRNVGVDSQGQDEQKDPGTWGRDGHFSRSRELQEESSSRFPGGMESGRQGDKLEPTGEL